MKRVVKLLLILFSVFVIANIWTTYSREHLSAAPGSSSQKNTYNLPPPAFKVVKPKPVRIRPAPTSRK